MFYETLFLSLIFLFGVSVLTTFNTALLRLGRYRSKELLKGSRSKYFFFRAILNKFFPQKNEWENSYFSISFTKHILYLLYASAAFFFLLAFYQIKTTDLQWVPLITIALTIIVVSITVDFFMRLIAHLWTRKILFLSASLASIFLIIFFPLVGILLKLTRYVFRISPLNRQVEGFYAVKDKLKEVMRDAELNRHLDPYDQKLISSFLTFRERVAREVMVPRIDITTLSASTSLEKASKLFLEEGYSRIPVYRESLDDIIGILHFKDLLRFIMQNIKQKTATEFFKETIEPLVKPVIYTPENKKISHLLQEFRSKQMHLAIVVDEYGGTEGIITLEDILEELVGEIEDEYDIEEDQQFWKLPNGSWIVNAKMSIIDIEENLGIKIPHNPEYETLGGYIFHRAGTIPSKGWSIHHDDFILEVLSSSERSIDKIRITPPFKEKSLQDDE